MRINQPCHGLLFALSLVLASALPSCRHRTTALPISTAVTAPSGDAGAVEPVAAGAEVTLRGRHRYLLDGRVTVTPRFIIERTVMGRGHVGSAEIEFAEGSQQTTLSFGTPDRRTQRWNGWEIEVSLIDGYQDAVTLTMRRAP